MYLFVVHCANPLTAYLPHSPDFFLMYLFCTPRKTLFFYQNHSPDFLGLCTFLLYTAPTRLLRIYLILRIFFLCTSFVHGAGGTKTTSKCCFWTTGEDHLMSRSSSDGEFSGRVTEAKLVIAE